MKYFLIVLLLIFTSCENNTKTVNDIEQNTDSLEITDEDGYNLESDDPYVDKKNGLIWAEKVLYPVRLDLAEQNCENYVEGGYGDYFLPAIEQLETLVKDCSDPEGCEEAEDGRYSVFGDTGRFWSSSQEYVTDVAVFKSPYPVPLYLDFNVGIKGYDQLSEKNLYQARCVREIKE